MARYIGPKTKISRKFGEPIFGPDRSFEKKNYPPGHHGQNKRRQKKSEYAIQLMEKQKAKYLYGILEKQFKNLFEKASRSAARQLVSHQHILVNGEICNIPSRIIKISETVAVREKSKSLASIESSLQNTTSYEWITWNIDKMEGVLNTLPQREQIPENIKEQLIVELYSK